MCLPFHQDAQCHAVTVKTMIAVVPKSVGLPLEWPCARMARVHSWNASGMTRVDADGEWTNVLKLDVPRTKSNMKGAV